MSDIVKCTCKHPDCKKAVYVYDSMLEIRLNDGGDVPDIAVYLDPNSIAELIAALRRELLRMAGVNA